MNVNFLTKPISEALIQWGDSLKELNQIHPPDYYDLLCKKIAELISADLVIVYSFHKHNNHYELNTNLPEISNINHLAGWLEKILLEESTPAKPLGSTFLMVLHHFDILPKNNFEFCFSYFTPQERISLFAAGISPEMAQWLNQYVHLYRHLLQHYLGLPFQNRPYFNSYIRIAVEQSQIKILEYSGLSTTIENQLQEIVGYLENKIELIHESSIIEYNNTFFQVRKIAGANNQWFLLFLEKQAVKTTQINNSKTDLILEHIPHGILILNDRGYIEYINPAAASILDANPNQLIGRHVGRFFANADYQRIIFQQFREQNGNIDNFPLQAITNTNLMRAVDISSRKIPDDKTLVFIQDARKQISHQQELQRKENEFNRLAQNPKILFAKVSNGGDIIESNVQLAKLLGYTLDGLVGKNIRNFIINKEINANQFIWEKILKGEITQYELKLQAPNVQPFIWLTTVQQVGDQLWFVGINVTELHKLEHTALTREKTIQIILENLPIGVMLIKRNHQVVFSNLSGYNPDQTSLYCHQLLFNSGEICPGCQLQSTFENNVVGKNFIHDETNTKAYQVIDIPIEQNDGSVDFIIEFVIDHTEQIQIRHQLKSAHEAAEKASKLKSHFLHNINHEIRSPLNAIMGFSKLMAGRSNENPEQKSMLEVIYNNGQTLLDTISKLVDLSQLQCGDYTLTKELFNLNKQIESLAGNFSNNPKVASGNIMLNMVQPNFHIWLRTDKKRLSQIMEQLMENAVRFTDHGNVSLMLDLTPEEVVISVTDNSPVYEGPPGELFEYFGKENLTKHPWHGAGIGLALAYHNAKALGGNLCYNPDYTKGCRFDLKLPRSIAETNEILKVPMFSWNNKTIIIAEDDFSSYLYLSELLSSTGVEIRHATNGRDTLQMLSPEIALILLDIQIPIIDGLEVAKHIRRMNYKVPIVALTANPYTERQCLEAGCNYFITKPVSSKTLLPILQHYLD